MAAPGGYGSRPAPENDIYTVLLGIALALVAGTFTFAIIRANELLGVPFPSFAS
ncbi:MAG: hypothetical protein KF841_01390 [Phycisphaerae bacterium]|nr:hypothetical protein [Phycisphaerae bacterium]